MNSETAIRIDAWEFPARASALQSLRDAVRVILREHHIAEVTSRDVVLAVNEACMNIIQHGYADSQGDIRIEIEKIGAVWCFRLIDSAPAVDKDCMQSRNLDEIRPGGLGMHFIEQIMDDVKLTHPHEGNGNILELTKRI